MYWFPIMTKEILGLFTLVFVFERSFILSRSRKLFEEIWPWPIEIPYLFGMNTSCTLCMNSKRGIKYRAIKIKKTEFNSVKHFTDSLPDNRWYLPLPWKKIKEKLVFTSFLEQIVFFLSKSVWTSFIFLIKFYIIVKAVNAHIEKVKFQTKQVSNKYIFNSCLLNLILPLLRLLLNYSIINSTSAKQYRINLQCK